MTSIESSSVPASYLHDKIVLVTGAAGTIGSELVEQIVAAGARVVRAFDHNESELFFLYERVRDSGRVAPMIGDIRDLERLRMAFRNVDVVFHAAALKHVELGEYNPFEIVETNLRGVDNVIRAALDAEVDRVIFTSSDKAVNPTNVMGASKMMGERLITAANSIRGQRRTRFAAVRFGNVLGSRGSVVPIFAAAAVRGDVLRLTHPEMTRYVMTIPEAAQLVIEAGGLTLGGEVFVTKMHAIRIADLASVIASKLARNGRRSEIVHTQPRAGEKLYEELLTHDEVAMSHETDRLLIVLPHRVSALSVEEPRPEAYNIALKPVTRLWHSGEDTCMTQDELSAYFQTHNLLGPWLPA
ncbi:MAG: SDR family NAD(P)-dependent oxidoreductase [Deltaproteobacteria bacterium]|nr:SDR family NAD(P)-dependent oxidoreductase [Deltaproteobacteria bacterium]